MQSWAWNVKTKKLEIQNKYYSINRMNTGYSQVIKSSQQRSGTLF